jgi:hypothetical protein
LGNKCTPLEYSFSLLFSSWLILTIGRCRPYELTGPDTDADVSSNLLLLLLLLLLQLIIIIIIIIYIRGDIALMYFFLFRPIVALSPAPPSWKMLVFVSLLAVFGTSQRLASVPLTNTVLLLSAPMQSMRWVKISTYLRSEWFLSIIFYSYNLVPKIVNNILGSSS